MKRVGVGSKIGWAFTILICIVLAGCGGNRLVSKEKDLKRLLAERVHDYWQALTDGRLRDSLEFVDPKVDRKEQESRLNRWARNFDVLDFEVQKIEIEGDTAKVWVKRRFRIQPGVIPVDPGVLTETRPEKWAFIYNNWFRVVKPVSRGLPALLERR